jgi:hypothetical protein
MPPVLTSNAVVLCSHGGKVNLIPKQMTVAVQGGMVMCEPDLIGSPITGCAQAPSPTTKPCTAVVSTFPGGSSPKVLVSGRPAYLATVKGLTDGVPPGTLVVTFAGQVAVQA